MSDPTRRPPGELAEIFQFRPKYWWDPVPWWIFQHLRADATRDLAVAQLEFEKSVLEAQVRTVERAMAVIKQVK